MKKILLLTILISISVTQLVTAQNHCSPPVYFAMMMHLEDDWHDDIDSAQFADHAFRLRMAVSFVKPYGAKFTVESAIPFAQGCINWNDNVLQAMLDPTMGVGSHSNSSADYAYTRNLVNQLVGSENNLGISGGWSGADATTPNNWADSAINAGFSYIDGPTYFIYLQIPQDQRPDSISDDAILDSLYHKPAPSDFYERIHPHLINSAFTWNTDTLGNILLLTGSLGEFSSIAEGRENCFPNCVLDSADVDTVVEYVNKAITEAEQNGYLTVVYMHTPLTSYTPQTKNIYSYLFQTLEPLVNSGELEYKTMGEIYDIFSQCTASNIPINQANDLFIYPNPTDEFIKIELLSPNEKIYSTKIINSMGQIIEKIDFEKKNNIKIQLPAQKGIYFIQIETDKQTFVRKIIKK